jgi:RNA polymerase sigma-70 factor (ECF subfamily)
VVQEVFATVCKKIETFSKDGRPAAFRRWLYTIFGFKWREYVGLHLDAPVDPSHLGRTPAPEDPSDTDDVPARVLLLRRLLDLVRPEFESRTWEAFWRVAAERRSAMDVAQELDMSAPAVHTAKSRVLKRLREEAEALGFYRAEGEVVAAEVAVATLREVTS